MSTDGATRATRAQNDPQPASGALAANLQRVGKTLSTTGFVNVTGQQQDNFKTYLDRNAFEIEVIDLDPKILADLATWVSNQITADPGEAQQEQAHVRSERAVKLLAN